MTDSQTPNIPSQNANDMTEERAREIPVCGLCCGHCRDFGYKAGLEAGRKEISSHLHIPVDQFQHIQSALLAADRMAYFIERNHSPTPTLIEMLFGYRALRAKCASPAREKVGPSDEVTK
jgi:hypothetical protein